MVGINLLREGLDLPEVALVAILDADKEGFLRSQTSLVQTTGRAARHENGRVIFTLMSSRIPYAIRWKSLIGGDQSRSSIMLITVLRLKALCDRCKRVCTKENTDEETPFIVSEDEDVEAVINELTVEMDEAASKLEFERAALLRDQIDALRSGDFSSGKKMRGRTYGKQGYAGRRR